MFAVLLVAGLAAPAEGVDLDFSWDAPQGCPQEAEVSARLEALLDGVQVLPHERITAIARVRQDSDAMWDLRIWLVGQGATRERVLQNRDCAALAEATALILAIAVAPELISSLDPQPLEQDPVESSAPTPPPPTPPQAPPPEPTQTAKRKPPTRNARRSVRGGLGLEAGASFGALPRVGADLAAAARVRLGRATIEARSMYGAPRRVRFDDLPDSGANFQMWTVGLRGGVALDVRPGLEAHVRGGVDAGQMLVEGVNLAPSRRASEAYVAVSVSGGLSYVPLRWLAVGVSLEGFVPMTRPRFSVTGASAALHRPWPVGVRLLAGPELRFP